jgi:hypothetical protein
MLHLFSLSLILLSANALLNNRQSAWQSVKGLFTLWFLVQFSPFDGCERVGQYQCFECMFPRLYICNWYTRSHPSKGENSSESYKCKQALKVVNWHWNYRQIVKINGEQQHWKLWLKNCCQHVTQLLVFHSLGVGMPMFWVEMCPNEHNVYPVYYTNNLLVNRECHRWLTLYDKYNWPLTPRPFYTK